MTKERSNSDSQLIVQGSILAGASIISRIIGLVYRIPLTAIIGKTGNDYYGTAYEIYNILLIISSYSIPLAVSKLVAARAAKAEQRNVMRVLKGSLLFASITGSAGMFIILFFNEELCAFLKTPFAAPALTVLGPVILIVALLGVFRGFFQGLSTMVPTAISQIIEQITNAVISIVCAYALFSYGQKAGKILVNAENTAASYGAAGGTMGTAAGAIAALLFILFLFLGFYAKYKKKIRKKISKGTIENRESYSSLIKILVLTIVPVLLSTTIYNISSIIDQTLFKNIAVTQGYEAKQISEWWGVYAGQFRVLINVPISIASAMASSAVVSLTKAFMLGKRASVKRQITSATRFTMLIAFPCTAGLMALSGPLMMLLFSDTDRTSSVMMLAGAISVVFFSLSTLSNGLLQGVDRLRIPVINAAISLGLQALLLILLMRVFNLNIYAVIIANAFYALLMCVLNNIALTRHANVRLNFVTTFVQPAAASAVMGVLTFLFYRAMHYITHSNTISTIISIIFGVIVYALILLLTRTISREEVERFPKGRKIAMLLTKMRLLPDEKRR